jgi:hypothetical protein
VAPIRERRLARRTHGAAAWALPGVALALVPKCPLCIAAYLAIGGGLSVSFSTATQLRTALVWLCWSALMLLAVRTSIRCIHRIRTARRHEGSSEGCREMTSIRASARLI